jgi:hypothetical protein
VLPSGQTLRGTFAIEYNAAGVGDRGISAVSFAIPLAVAPAVELHDVGAAPTANCPGTSDNPQAAPGKFCAYATFANQVGFKCIAKTGSSYTCGHADQYGTSVFIDSSAAGQVSFVGSWAVTAQ